MMFVSLGINTNIRVYKGWFITGRIQEGWGQEFESPDHLTNNIADQTVYNEFYYVGIKYLFNYK